MEEVAWGCIRPGNKAGMTQDRTSIAHCRSLQDALWLEGVGGWKVEEELVGLAGDML